MGRQRLGGTIRWACTLAAVLVTAIWIVSAWCTFGLVKVVPYPGGGYAPISWNYWFGAGCWFCYDSQGNTRLDFGTHWIGRCSAFHIRWLGERVGGYWFGYPIWPVALALAAVSTRLWAPRLRARWMVSRGRCTCGYDRHGLAPDVRCPECGNAP